MRKTKYCAIHIEFQERDSTRVHSFVWIFNTPNIQNEAACIELIEKTIYGQLQNHLADLERFELVKTCQVHAHSRTCWKYKKNKCHFSYGHYFTKNKMIVEPLNSKFSNGETQDV